jgi:uncharacterized protein YbjT (DUF2867 family)
MKILLTGANGFIGSRLRHALLADGHDLVCAGRRGGPGGPRCRWVRADFGATEAPPWPRYLAGVDAVVNAAGIFRATSRADFAQVHTRGPIALFEACAAAGVRRVVQLSALGATADAPAPFLRSKHAADARLIELPLDATVVQPSLVFGAEGRSSAALLSWASLPLLPLPAGGAQAVQPVHVDDLIAALQALLVAPPGRWRGRVAAVGPQALTLRDYVSTLRRAIGLAPARTLSLPAPLVAVAARAGEHLPGALFDRAAWQMLQQGSVADAATITALLGRRPRPAAAFVATGEAAALRVRAQLSWLRPVLRLSLAFVWIATAVVSLGIHPRADSHALLGRTGVPQALQPLALYAAAALDLLLGVLTLAPLRRPRVLWAAQAALIVGYSAIIALHLPEFWTHPYGPLTKNVPMLALLWLLWTLETPAAPARASPARWTT